MNDAFVNRWIDDWNHQNLESILSHYAPDVEFVSPKALQIAGNSTIHGKDALRAYWTAGIQKLPDLHFTLDHWIWEGNRRELLILYVARLSGVKMRACEITRFRPDGLIFYGEALYGIQITA